MPKAPPHPDDLRATLAEAAGRRAEAERERADAMLDLTRTIRLAYEWDHLEDGLTIKEMSQITGLSRVTIYGMIEDLRPTSASAVNGATAEDR